ncbi:sensor histidine kinase [Azospirillum sp. ST 5-10]|uniref:sensor histidine kinase n=1 Tax=unclassified Azospirillum TaxID=2630922 RepID=UPI003F49C8CE
MPGSDTSTLPPAAPASAAAAARGPGLRPLLAGGSATLLLVVVALLALLLAGQTIVERQIRDGGERVIPAVQDRQRAALNLERFKRHATVAVAAGDAETRHEALRLARTLAVHPSFRFDAAVLRHLDAALAALNEAAALMDRAEAQRDSAAPSTADADAERRRQAAALMRQAAERWRGAADALDTLADRLADDAGGLTAAHVSAVQDGAQRVLRLAVGGGLVALLVLAGAAWLAWRHVAAPVAAAAAMLADVTDGGHPGDGSLRLPATGNRDVDTVLRAVENLDRIAGVRQAALVRLAQHEGMAALGSQVAGLAHEIASPLGVAATAASLLGDRAREVADALRAGRLRRADLEEYLGVIAEATHGVEANVGRAARLADSLKHVAVDRAGDVCRRFLLKDCLDDVMRTLSVSLRRAGLSVTIDCADDLAVEGDPGALGQILTNFAMNAMMHAYAPGERGRLTVSARADGAEEVVLRFADDGRGIPPEVRLHVFEPFFTTARDQGGSGLGLHIVFDLVTQRLKGRIAVDSTPGAGTAFTIRFPRRLERA